MFRLEIEVVSKVSPGCQGSYIMLIDEDRPSNEPILVLVNSTSKLNGMKLPENDPMVRRELRNRQNLG